MNISSMKWLKILSATDKDVKWALERIKELESMVGQAYIVIGNIEGNLETDSPNIHSALDYFSNIEYDEDFLPWDLNIKHTSPDEPPG